MRSVLTPFAAISSFLALVQVFCLGLSVAGLRLGRPVAILVLVVSAGLASWFASRVWRDTGSAGGSAWPSGVVEWTLSALVVAVLGWAAWVWVDLLTLAWHRPPLDWDSLVYHVPAIHDWVRRGRVAFIDSVPDVPFVNYPMGTQVAAFLVHQVSGTTRLVDASNLWHAPLGLTALAVVAAEFGARGVWRWLAGGLLFTVPPFVAQGASAYVDAGFAITVMGSLAASCAFVSPSATGRWWGPVLLGLNLGLMMGAKGSGLPFAFVCLAATAVALVRLSGVARARSLVAPWLVCMMTACTVGAYWYVRNGLVTGNPLYPYRLQIGHLVLGKGFGLEFLIGNTDPALLRHPDWVRPFAMWLLPSVPVRGAEGGSEGGLGFLWIAGAVPAIVYWWFVTLWRRERGPLSTLALTTAIVCVLFAIQPVAWEARFTLWVYGLGLPCLAAALHDGATRWRSHPTRLLTIACGVAVVTVAGLESSRTLAVEWQAHRDTRGGEAAPGFLPAVDVCFPGMAVADGYREFLAAGTVARGRWSRTQHVGSLLGGVLAMPLGARQVLVYPPSTPEDLADPYRAGSVRLPPTAADIVRARAAGARWFLWEADAAGDVPEPLAPFRERYSYDVFRLDREAGHPDPRATQPAGR